MEAYFNRRSYQQRTGTFVFLVTDGLEEAAAKQIIAEIRRCYGAGYQIQLWHLSGVHGMQGGGDPAAP